MIRQKNVLLVTNKCNCSCIMCPQNPSHDPAHLHELNLRLLESARTEGMPVVILTGGEPTLVLDRLRHLLKVCKTKLPRTDVLLLTNGRAFKDIEIVRKIVSIQHSSLTFCVSLQADVDVIHDRIMGVKGAFAETVTGLHNLALQKQRVEIRVVIMRENYQRLPMLAEYIYRNMPFACHVALMGLELTGLAIDNISKVWIDPTDYAPFLMEAVRDLHRRDLRVSVYNLPLCLIPSQLWRFARDSISDWKKTFLPKCSACAVRETCPGLFATSAVQSANIRPIRSVTCSN